MMDEDELRPALLQNRRDELQEHGLHVPRSPAEIEDWLEENREEVIEALE